MWRRKLAALLIFAAILIVVAIPFRTQAVKLELTDKNWSAQFSLLSPREMFETMVFTPKAVMMIAAIVAVTAFLAARIIRSR